MNKQSKNCTWAKLEKQEWKWTRWWQQEAKYKMVQESILLRQTASQEEKKIQGFISFNGLWLTLTVYISFYPPVPP